MPIPPEVEAVALLGWALYPASNRSKAACFEGATDAATCDLDVLEDWCRRFHDPNWRVVFGPSRLWGLDCDTTDTHANEGVQAIADLQAVHGALPIGPRARSGGGGLGFFFQHQGEPIRGDAGYPAKGIDPRRGRQSQTIPPSRHIVTGRFYEWLTPPWEAPAPVAPEWLLRKVAIPPPVTVRAAPPVEAMEQRPYAIAALRSAIQRVASARDGTRNNTLNRETWSIGRFVPTGCLSVSEVREAMFTAAKVAGLEPRASLITIDGALRRAVGR